LKKTVSIAFLAFLAFSVASSWNIAAINEYSFGSVLWQSGKFRYVNDNWETITYYDRPTFTFSYTSPYSGVSVVDIRNRIDTGGSPDIYMKYNDPSSRPARYPVTSSEVDGWIHVGDGGSMYIDKDVTVTFRVTPYVHLYEDIETPGTPWTYSEQWHHYYGFSGDFYIETLDDVPGESSLQAGFTWSPQNPTTLDTLSVTSTSTSDSSITSYLWFVDGDLDPDIQGASSWDWTNPTAGEIMITLMIKDSTGASDSFTEWITVKNLGAPEVTPRIVMTPENPTAGESVTFMDGSTVLGVPEVTRSWYLDDYYVEYAGTDAAWIWDQPTSGPHTVTLELYDGSNLYTKELDFTVASSSEIILDFTWTPDAPATGGPVTFMADIQASGTQVDEIFWYIDGAHQDGAYNQVTWTWTPPYEEVFTVELKALGQDGRFASTSKQLYVGARPLVTGKIVDKKGGPLPDILVSLVTNIVVESTYTDENGEFMVVNSPNLGDGLDYFFKIDFMDRQNTFYMFDEKQSKTDIAFLVLGPYNFDTIEDMNLTLRVQNGPDVSPLEREDHREALAEMYIAFYQAARFYDTEHAFTFNSPVFIWTHATYIDEAVFTTTGLHPLSNPPTTSYPCIILNEAASPAGLFEAPMNREWHEFSHFFMYDQYGELPPSHEELQPDGQLDWIDENHDGFKNHCSSDSYTEAFAEFMPLFMQIEYGTETLGAQTWGYAPTYWYTVGNTVMLYEVNYERADDEEYAIAGILYDLWDGIDAKDHDVIDLEFDDIMEILMWDHTLTTFYQYNSQTGKTELIESQGISSNRHIHYVTDIYDYLSRELETYEITQSQLDDLFINHGFYVASAKSGKYTIGDKVAAYSVSNPERRKYEVPAESMITIKSDGKDSDLIISVSFDSPFSEYDYWYTVPLTQGSQQVGILPPPSNYNATLSFEVYTGGEQAKETYSLTNTEYRAKLGNGGTLDSYSFTTSSFNLVSLGINAAKVLAVLLVGFVVLGYLSEKGIV